MTDVLAKIIEREPDFSALPPKTPPAIRKLLRRCLEKDRAERLRDMGDARLEVSESLREPHVPLPAGARHTVRRLLGTVGAALAAGLLLGVLATMLTRAWWAWPASVSSALVSAPAVRSAIELPPEAPLTLGATVPFIGFDSPVLAVSPSGTHLMYVGRSASGDTMLFLRAMTDFDVQPLQGTEGAIHAFFSPDGRSVGFLTNDRVKKISLEGGTPVTLCDARTPVRASWTRDDVIYFTEDQGSRLSRVAAQGGAPPEVVTALSVGHQIGDVLPDGKMALVTVGGRGISSDYADVVLMSLDTFERKVLVQSGYDARYVAPGYLIFARGGSLMAVRVDVERAEVLGEPVPVAEDVAMESLFGQVHAAISDNGLLAYVPGGDRSVGRLAWVDRRGVTEFVEAPPRVYGVVDLSADGGRLAVHVTDVNDYVWIYDLTRREGRRSSLCAERSALRN